MRHAVETLAAVALLAAFPSPATSGSGAVASRDRIVVLISIDGLPAYAFDDPRLPAPTLKRLAREGVRARGLGVVNPSVTWPNHTTLVTGVRPARHGVLANGLLLRAGAKGPVRVEQRGREDLVRAPTVYDLAHAAGLTTAQVDWIPPQVGGTITWAFPERPDPRGAVEREMIAAGIVGEADVAEFNTRSNGPWRDQVWTEAAVHIIRRRRPNLLLLHLLNLDSTHHRYGPRTPAGFTGIALADARVAEVLAALEAAGLTDRATVMVVSDHGFKTVRRVIRPNAAFRREGLLRPEGDAVAGDAYAVSEGGTAIVYLTPSPERVATLARAKAILARLEGVERVFEPPEFAALGLPTPEENPQMGDLFLAARPDYGFAGGHEGEPVGPVPEDGSLGYHGYLSTDPEIDATFIAWGYGIRAGAALDRVENVDVAPTVAALLGLKMEDVSGRVLTEILK